MTSDHSGSKCRARSFGALVQGARMTAGAAGLGLLLLAPRPAGAADLRAIFVLLDENGDGVIDRQEFQRRKTEVFFLRLPQQAEVTSVELADTQLTPEAFRDADINGDGKLSGSEFIQARFAQFETYDTNHDQKITFEEFETGARQFVRN
jgi:Ca2+-binding EF-hand superfamily protein